MANNLKVDKQDIEKVLIDLQNRQAAFQAQAGAAPTQAQFNALLTALINAGLMKAS
ncbi:hypothetical protein IVA80_15280 [Bradyrhizobium sp. 139]|uniref:hypothetical protein n=1 Tax=Bradyrhizobium sp. 139 TaxID=2782616 RepID=UPI001FF7CC2B|nr:hypothetical protein [Bradyrhizobium sp. 139]MCK1742186.1 hypothetical protein [Bradyrhizobium sp. 139]